MRPAKLIILATVVVRTAGAGECVAVSGDRILIKDLVRARSVFAAADPEAFVGFAPAPGVRRVFTEGQLRRLMRAHGLAEVPVEPVCFERTAAALSPETVAAAIERAWEGRAVRVEVVDYDRRPVPNGRLEFSLNRLQAPAGATPQSVLLWRGRVVYGRGRSVPFWAKVRLSERRKLVVARNELQPGEPLREGDVAEEEKEVAPTMPKGFTHLDEVIGARPRRRIAAGEPLRLSDLVLPTAVSRGDLIRVEVFSGRARLAFEARAENSAREGEIVRLRSPLNAGVRITAEVVAPGRAVVRAGREGGRRQ